MMNRLLTDVWAEMRTATPERWTLLGVTIGLAVVMASLARIEHPIVLVGVIALATLAALQPATNTALVVIAILLARWLATADDPSSLEILGMALALLVFHLAVALMAATPHAAPIDRSLLLVWGRRTLAVAAVTVAMMLVVRLLDGRTADGSTILTAATVLLLAVGALATRQAALGRQN